MCWPPIGMWALIGVPRRSAALTTLLRLALLDNGRSLGPGQLLAERLQLGCQQIGPPDRFEVRSIGLDVLLLVLLFEEMGRLDRPDRHHDRPHDVPEHREPECQNTVPGEWPDLEE